MKTIKYAIALAHYSVGIATENGQIIWFHSLDENRINWVDEFEDAQLFDSKEIVKTTAKELIRIKGELVAIVCVNFTDETNER
ncbi:hypothetical protein [Kamptonema sp. UHCC 0994]|uniref:hypothetical protein n=1 Tax=Kamptonema sp. UHCC 0994 TaxID=3031329 RepID=UPI0023BB034E|nr:hypothetical protein [Kamptonema sp. UHCC 0994]MDF0556454.1 hypothetical protein [Kamptonema sp. UHCC 0994]